MAVTKQKKDEIYKELVEAFKNAKSIAVGKTSGMSVTESQEFRRKLRENDVQFKIAKKTLIALAAKEAGYANVDKSMLDGSVGLAFSPDEVTGAKLVKQADPKGEKMELVALFMEGALLDKAAANELADIPGMEQLLSKFIGVLQSPLNSFGSILNSPLSSFARGLSAYAEQHAEQGEAPPVAAKEEAATPVEEKSVAEEKPEEEQKASVDTDVADKSEDAEASAE